MNNKGFTLIEILISLIILAVLILAVNKVIYTVKKANTISENNFEASIYAENLLEFLKSTNTELNEGDFSPNELLDKNIKEFLENGSADNQYDNSVIKIKKIYENIDSESKIFKVEMLIIWEGVNNDEKSYKIATYIYQ
mgnify:CR=1 FL=1